MYYYDLYPTLAFTKIRMCYSLLQVAPGMLNECNQIDLARV